MGANLEGVVFQPDVLTMACVCARMKTMPVPSIAHIRRRRRVGMNQGLSAPTYGCSTLKGDSGQIGDLVRVFCRQFDMMLKKSRDFEPLIVVIRD